MTESTTVSSLRSEGICGSTSLNEPYNLVLLDWKMPEMDGLEATAAIRALNRPDSRVVPIIAMTANAFDEDVQRSLQAGMDAHLSKPVEPEHLYQTLGELIYVKDGVSRKGWRPDISHVIK